MVHQFLSHRFCQRTMHTYYTVSVPSGPALPPRDEVQPSDYFPERDFPPPRIPLVSGIHRAEQKTNLAGPEGKLPDEKHPDKKRPN
jgi:hypothetical protein